jgi:hypothetical protein
MSMKASGSGSALFGQADREGSIRLQVARVPRLGSLGDAAGMVTVRRVIPACL